MSNPTMTTDNPTGKEYKVRLPMFGENSVIQYCSYLEWLGERKIEIKESYHKCMFETPEGHVNIPFSFFFYNNEDAVAFKLKFGL